MATLAPLAGSGYGNPFIDALVWGGLKWSGTIKVYFGNAADFNSTDPLIANHRQELGVDGWAAEEWTNAEKEAFDYAMSVFSSVCNVTFEKANSVTEADIVWWKGDMETAAYHESPRQGQAWGFFNSHYPTWNLRSFGADGLHTILSALGVALGLVPPSYSEQDPTGGTPFPPAGILFTWDQGIWTVMTSGDTGMEGGFHDETFGAQGALGAFDIAALQAIYGAKANNTGNDVYALPLTQGPGTGWKAIWDTGGIDTITAAGSPMRVSIDLREATMQVNDTAAGGYYSAKIDISGGFTIAKGVVIENAIGGNSGDLLQGNAANNGLWGGEGRDTLYGENGNDSLHGEGNQDTIYGGSGNDLIRGGLDDDIVYAGADHDKVYGDDGSDHMYGGSGNDSIYGGAGNDLLNGEAGTNYLNGGSGRDTLIGGTGTDKLYGGSDNDTLRGSNGNDTLYGDSETDYLDAGNGNDKIYGGTGSDFLVGGAGNDTLWGGAHMDRYYGGSGSDRFVLDTRPTRSTIPDYFDDFNPRYDTICLSKSAFKMKAGKLKKSAFVIGSKAKDKDDRIVVDTKKKIIYWDPDGAGGTSQYAIAKLDKAKGITYRDFEVI